MEVPGRDVTADALGPDTETPRTEGMPEPEVTRPDAARAASARDDDDESLGDKVREVAEKVKDAVTPDHDKP
ncbi:MAG TPA: hypothetical protein VGO71_18490 [Baekduia sp.]|jgi:hypothetical protein|nr:hypothetical protein [Baekduia sp.]